MYKLLALDLDGTLLKNGSKISKKVKESIKRLRDKGIKVILVSGREPRSISKFAKELNLEEYIIALNGAIITDSKIKQILFRKDIEIEVSKEIITLSEGKSIQSMLFIEDKIYTSKEGPYLELFKQYTDTPVEIVGNLSHFYKEYKVGKIILADEYDVLKEAKNRLGNKFKKSINIDFSKPYFLEIYNFNTSKGIMLERIADHYGIDRNEVVAIGDGENDISMIEYAGLGVAMGNALKIVKDKADLVTDTNTEDGVSRIIEEYFLKTLS